MEKKEQQTALMQYPLPSMKASAACTVLPPEAAKILRDLLQQAFSIFNVFSRKPEDLADIFGGFSVALSDFTADQLTLGFTIWLRNEDCFPTPANIRRIILAEEKREREAAQAAEYIRDRDEVMAKVWGNA